MVQTKLCLIIELIDQLAKDVMQMRHSVTLLIFFVIGIYVINVPKITVAQDDRIAISVENAAQLTLLARLEGHTPVESFGAIVFGLTFSPDSQTLASGSHDTTVKLWDVASGTEKATLTDAEAPVVVVAYNADGTTLSAAGYDTLMRTYDTASGELISTWDLMPEEEFASSLGLVFSPDGATFLLPGPDGLYLYDMATTNRRTIETSVDVFRGGNAAFSTDGTQIALTGEEEGNQIHVLDAATGAEVQTLTGPDDARYAIDALAFNAQWLAVVDFYLTIDVFDRATGEMVARLRGVEFEGINGVYSLVFSPDGTILASGATGTPDINKETIHLWDVAT